MSTVIDDWAEQANFEGMPVGPLGKKFTFNGGRCSFWDENGLDLEVVQWRGTNHRGLKVSSGLPELVGLTLSFHCPSLVIDFKVLVAERTTVMIGKKDGSSSNIKWNKDPLFDIASSNSTERKFFSPRKLKQNNRLLFLGRETLLKQIVVTDCTECRGLPDC